MKRNSHVARLLVVAAMGIVVVGCSEGKGPASDTGAAVAQQPVKSVASKRQGPDPKAVVEMATHYDFPDPRGAVSADVPIDTMHNNKGMMRADKPQTITIAKAVPKSGYTPPAGQELVALVYSTKAYHGLGIEQGNNYVWRDRSAANSSDWEVWMISDTPLRGVQLLRGSVAYSHDTVETPRLVGWEYKKKDTPISTRDVDMIAYGVCIDDPVLCGGHCGYSY
jgi:hypothetical protein